MGCINRLHVGGDVAVIVNIKHIHALRTVFVSVVMIFIPIGLTFTYVINKLHEIMNVEVFPNSQQQKYITLLEFSPGYKVISKFEADEQIQRHN